VIVELLFSVLKIVLVIGFCLNFSAIAVWADRRQSAMVQHRVGPNRAVVNVPSFIIRGALAAPGFLIGALMFFSLGLAGSPGSAISRMGVSLHMAVFVAWFSLTVLAWRVHRAGALNAVEELLGQNLPRTYFYTGMVLHMVVFIVNSIIEKRLAEGAFSGATAFALAKGTAAFLGGLMAASGVYASMRVPPGKIGIRLAGTLHGIADAVKMMFKEDFIPKNADRVLHALGPMVAMFPALVVMAVTPFGDQLCFQDVPQLADGKMLKPDGVFQFNEILHVTQVMPRGGVCEGHSVSMQIADLNVGILYLFAMSSTGVIGAAIAGWASDNKFSLLGGLRAASQMVSYEVAMGLSLMGLLLIYGTVRLGPMVQWQNDFAWGVFVQPLAFLMFLAATMAETKRVPFDQPEGESEIVAGYFLEYSGFKFGMFMAGEYVEVLTASALIITLFFGGYSLPFLYSDGIHVTFGDTTLLQFKMNHLAVTIIQVLTFFGKTLLFSWLQIFFRWTLPRFRYDQLMKFGWTVLLPVAIGNLIVTAVVVVALDAAGPGAARLLTMAGQLTQFVVAAGLLALPAGVIWLLLRPVETKRFFASTTAEAVDARGGVKPTPMQA
jgi:NADH-quinone oxidoreductase subunit H